MVDVAGNHPRTKGNTGDNRRLSTGVIPLDISGRVTLGETEGLSFSESFSVVGAFGRHLRKNEVGGAVQDAHHPLNRFTAQALAQRTDQRDTAGHRGLKQQVNTVGVGKLKEFNANVREKFFVSRDDRLACAQRR